MSDAERVEGLLLREWTTGLRLTTIPQAMERLTIKDEPRLRWRVAEHLEALWRDALTSPEKRRGITAALGRSFDETQTEQWRQQVATRGLASILLTDKEKLIARYILIYQREKGSIPQLVTIARALELPARETQKALRMLGSLGFLSLPSARSFANYGLANGYEKFLEGLGFSFHTVTLDMGDRFGVP